MSAEAENEISVRQWLEKYYACLRGPRDFAAQFENDWHDSNFSDNNEMHRHISCFVKLLAAITDPYILDNYYIWFYQHGMPFSGKQYDDIRFDPLSGKRNGQYFTVKLNHAGRKKWSLYSERFGYFAPEYECDAVRDMAQYIDGMGREFAQGIKPAFLSEKWAVERFIALQDGLFCDRIVYRAGEHRYQYHSSNNPKLRTAIVASASGKLPDGFPLEQAKEFRGLLVWSPDGMECDEEKGTAIQEGQISKKKREVER